MPWIIHAHPLNADKIRVDFPDVEVRDDAVDYAKGADGKMLLALSQISQDGWHHLSQDGWHHYAEWIDAKSPTSE